MRRVPQHNFVASCAGFARILVSTNVLLTSMNGYAVSSRAMGHEEVTVAAASRPGGSAGGRSPGRLATYGLGIGTVALLAGLLASATVAGSGPVPRAVVLVVVSTIVSLVGGYLVGYVAEPVQDRLRGVRRRVRPIDSRATPNPAPSSDRTPHRTHRHGSQAADSRHPFPVEW